jgi:general secretion pathway protein C
MSDEQKPPKGSDKEPTQPEFTLEPPDLPQAESSEPAGPSLSPFLDPSGLPSAPPPPEMAPPAQGPAEPLTPSEPLVGSEPPPAPEEPTRPGIPSPPAAADAVTSPGMSMPPSPEASISFDMPEEPPRNALEKVARKLQKAALTLRQRFETLGIREKMARFGLQEKLARLLPQSTASKLPKTLDPAELAQWAEKSLSGGDVAKYGWAIVVVLSAFFLADLVSLMLGRFIPDAPPIRVARNGGATARPPRTIDQYGVIFSRNLFNSRGVIPGEEAGTPTDTNLDGPAQRTSLPINLVGTIILRDELRSLATLEDKTAQMVYPVRVDDEIPGKLRVLKVEARRVEFINIGSNRKEFIDIPEDASTKVASLAPARKAGGPGIEQVSNSQFNVARTAIDAALSDMSKVLTQARAIPHTENGQMVGFKLFSIVPGSIYDQLGLKNGDLLCGVDGEPMTDPAKAMTLVTEIKNRSRLELCVKRDGRTQNYQYDIR